MAEVTPERYPISVAVAPAILVVFAVIASACAVVIPVLAVFAVIASACAVVIPVFAVFAVIASAWAVVIPLEADIAYGTLINFVVPISSLPYVTLIE